MPEILKDEVKAEIIDQIHRNNFTYLLDYLSNKFGEETETSKIINSAIIELNRELLIHQLPENGLIYQLTDNGNKIAISGGYLAHKKELQRISEKEMIVSETEFNKLVIEEKLARWQAKTFWPLFILAIVGGVSGIVSLIMQVIGK